MSQQWTFYMSTVEGESVAMFVDLRAGEERAPGTLCHLGKVSVRLRDPSPAGFPQGRESAVLDELEARLTDELALPGISRYVGRCTHAGMRHFFFYRLDVSRWRQQVELAMLRFHTVYDHQASSREERDWETYWTFLHPSPTELRIVEDLRLVEQLGRMGDQLDEPREIRHLVTFADEQGQAGFEAGAHQFGFVTLDKATKGSLGVRLARVDAPAPPRIHEVTVLLAELASRFGGDYKGWESGMVAAAPPPPPRQREPEPQPVTVPAPPQPARQPFIRRR